MATKPPSGTFRDPFNKWEDGSTRAVSQLLKSAVEQKAKLTKAEARVQVLKSSLTNLKGSEADIAKKLLVEALRELKEAQKSISKTSINASQLTDLQRDTAGKLATIRTWMASQTLSPQEEQRAKIVKQLLERTLADVSKSNIKAVDFKKVEQTLRVIEEHTVALPEELSERLAATEQTLLDIKQRQEEARKFLEEHKRMLSAFGSRILQGLGNMSMRLADRIGVGPLTLGNAIRGAGLIGRGLASAGRFGARVFKGETYVQRYLAAKRQLKEEPTSEDSLAGRLLDTVKKLGASNIWFQRRLLKEIERQGKTKDQDKGSILGKLGLLLSGLVGSVSKFFGSGGLLKTLGTLSRWISPLAGAAQFLMTRAMPVIGAFLGGWKLGGMIYEKYAVQIQDAIDNTIGALKSAYDWVSNKIGGVKDWTVNAVQKSKAAVVGASQSVYNKVVDTASSVGQAVTGAATSIATSTPVQAATTAITGAYNAGANVGSYIRQGASKLSDLVGTVISKGPNANLDGLDPSMQGSLSAMARDYFAATGKKLQFNSGLRSNEEQERLFRSMPAGMAARPGSSLHNYGLAADVQSTQANELQRLGLLDKYGFSRPISNEPWHIQPKGISLAAAKAGVYSADAPKNQGTAVPATQTATTSVSTTSGQPLGASSVLTGIGQQTKGPKAISGSKPVSLNDIPTHDMSDGLLVALNLGVLG